MLISISLNDNIVDTERSDGICSITVTVDDVSGLLLHRSILFIKHSGSA